MTKTVPAVSELYQTLTISNIQEETRGVKTFTFAETLPYKPGQYLTFILPNHDPEVRRSYSLASAPVLNEPLTIGVKRVENGIFSRHLIDHAQIGDKLLTTGVGGFFTLPDNLNAYGQVFFLAAGSGITPIFSLIKTILFSNKNLPIVLIYSNRSHDEAIFHDELITLADQFPNRFKVEFLFSNAADLARARLYKDLLQVFVKQYAQTSPDKMLAYVCGPENYMRMCVYGLHLAGVPLENIRKENFSSQKVLLKVEPPDSEKHLVKINFKGQEFSFESQYPDSILQAAKKHGIALPYSCEAGKCGSCAAQCTKGNVWMSYNEVLTDKEVAKGLVLTCTGYPIGGNIKLEIR
jgi:ring-1,2-phenylacetyl-CoA epoxidase subunit PaaE